MGIRPVHFSNMMTSDSPTVARVVLGIIAAMAISIPLAITVKDSRELALLRNTAQVTEGRVTKKNCANHGKLGYSYLVNGHAYTGAGTLVGKACADVGIDDGIDIMYSTERPQLSRCDSLASWQGTINGNFFALGLIGFAAVIIIFRITRVGGKR